jgi:enoyl-[acyl-carrier protein] reductase I
MKNWAIILGGSSGLGLATAKELARLGWNLVIVHRDRKSVMRDVETHFAEIAAMGVSLRSFNVDAMKPEKRQAVFDELTTLLGKGEKVGVLVHSIAKGNLKPMISENGPRLQQDDFQLTIEAMAISLYEWVQALYEAQLFAADTRIISFTSEGNRKAWQNYAAVSAAKAALEAITRNIALEFAPHGFRANCVQAGTTDTASLRMIPGNEQLKAHSLQRNPFGRLTLPEDVARVVGLLVQPEAAWINGAVIPVDGGEHIR